MADGPRRPANRPYPLSEHLFRLTASAEIQTILARIVVLYHPLVVNPFGPLKFAALVGCHVWLVWTERFATRTREKPMRRLTILRVAIVAIAVALILPTVVSAQTIHVLITSVNEVPIGCAVDRDNIKNVFNSHVAPAQLDLQVLEGDGITKDTIFDKIANLNVSAHDAIVFCWLGHGAYDQNGHYFAYHDTFVVYRSDVLRR